MAPVYVKHARQLVAVAQGFEPNPADTVKLLTDALAHAMHQASTSPDDAIAHLRDSFETIEAAKAQARHASSDPYTFSSTASTGGSF
ncbi:hypothetical protein [Falsirhodobacter sp. 20TX0035]|uniref:hypothetical protein n=1 Tax=Falsirhodobacter sp. 20TX0035 TaxID=3022019 RepID=UPI00232B57D7|nr:hypothetical protein [Falsirhodobacter sp. 20TX0035]MDB6454468.1 hypothetical protein [Falsirhodobacter sp. 20TX0035]